MSLALAGLIAVVPFLLPHRQATAFYSEWVAVALGMAACFPLLLKAFWSRLEIPHTAIWLLALILLIVLQAYLVNHVYVTQALLPGIYLVWATILIILCAWVREQLGLDRAVVVLAWMILIGGTIQAVIGLIQYFDVAGELASIVDTRQSTSINGNTGQRNHFATQITLAGFALIYLYATDRANRTLTIALSVLFALVLTISSSRAAAVYITAGFLLSLVFYRATRTSVHRRLLHAVGLLLLLFLLFQYLLPLFGGWLKLLLSAMGFEVSGFDTLVAFQRNATDGIDLRTSEWHKAWLMFLESPIWGIGIGNYGWHSFGYQALPEFAAVQKGDLFNHSHNLVMQVLAELGIVGLLLLILMVTSWLRHALPFWNNPSYWLIFTSLIVLLIHSNVEYPLWYSYFLGIAAVLLGLGSERSLRIQFTPGLGQFTSGITLVFAGAMLGITFLGFQDLIHVHRLVAATTPQQAFVTLQAISKNPLLTPWAEVSIAQNGIPDKNIIQQQLLMTTRVMRYLPNPINVNRQIVYLALAGESTEASALLKKAFIVYPLDFPKYACGWKSTPVEEVQSLWQEAEKQVGTSTECQQE